MTIRTFRPKKETTPSFTNGLPYDVKRAIALYGRHSSKEQNGNVATKQQTVGLEREALKMGFALVLHRTFYEDLKGVSAYKVPMDERKSYSDLYNAIVRGEIGTVLCYLVDRLFRTKNGEEWELFINACARNNVIVITAASPMRVYDLSTSKDADDFRQKCMASRTFIEEHVKGRLNAARDEMGFMGRWSGCGTPVGFFVDQDDTSETYRQYFIYEPHAKIVRAIFARYRELNGAFNKLMRELEMKQPIFPLFEDVEKIPNIQLIMNEEKTGYIVGNDGLRSILTNPMYIGIHTFKGQTIIDNHDAIVNREDFFYAFDKISRYDLEGNEKETARTRTQGYSGEIRRGADALLRGKLTSPTFTDACVYSPQKAYSFQQKNHGFSSHNMMIPIATLDSVVSDQLVKMLQHWKNVDDSNIRAASQKLQSVSQALMSKLHALKDTVQEGDVLASFPFDTFLRDAMPDAYINPYSAFEGVVQASETVIASIDDQLPAIKARIAKLRRNLDLDADAETLASWASELKSKVKELARLEAKQKAIAESQSSQEEATDLMKRVPDEWEQMKFEKRLRAIELFVGNVEVEDVAPHFLRIAVTWKLPIEHTITLYVWRHEPTNFAWTDEEEALMRKYYPTTPIRDMLALLPRRSWSTMKTHAGRTLHLLRTCGTPYDMPINITMQDIEFMRTHGIENLDTKATMQVFTAKDAHNISNAHS